MQATAQVANLARIPCCYGCGVGLQLQLAFEHQPENFHVPQVRPEKEKRKKKKKKKALIQNTTKHKIFLLSPTSERKQELQLISFFL